MASEFRIDSPKHISACEKCLMDENHPFGLILDKNKICSGCKEKKHKIKNKTLKLLSSYIDETISNYPEKNKDFDCVIPVSGDKESFTIVRYVIEKLKLRPLCTFFNHHFNTDVGLSNLQNLKHYFDLID